jgi:16S rRNA (uracil1498-N3)-methyltransferase
MKIHRFIGNWDLSKTELEVTDPKNIKQIKDVLRLKIGEKIVLSDGKGISAEVILTSISSRKIVGHIEKIEKQNKESKKVNLYLAVLKKENFELAVQKAVECGVSKIIPIITERTIKTGLNIERLNKIILEACEQSGRNIVPTLSPILKFTDALIDGAQAEEKVIFHFVDKKYNPSASKSISIFIGPEGGFTEKEISLAKEKGYTIASLGPLTLRAETAAIIGTYRAVSGI